MRAFVLTIFYLLGRKYSPAIGSLRGVLICPRTEKGGVMIRVTEMRDELTKRRRQFVAGVALASILIACTDVAAPKNGASPYATQDGQRRNPPRWTRYLPHHARVRGGLQIGNSRYT